VAASLHINDILNFALSIYDDVVKVVRVLNPSNIFKEILNNSLTEN